jgi:hypothetical protein
MAVVVKFHGIAAPSVEAWRRWMLAQPPHDPGIADLMIDALAKHLEQTNGLPQGTTHRGDLSPPRFVWRYTSNAWVQYVRRVSPNGRDVKVVVIGVSDQPPP